jgi:hypothetical protein
VQGVVPVAAVEVVAAAAAVQGVVAGAAEECRVESRNAIRDGVVTAVSEHADSTDLERPVLAGLAVLVHLNEHRAGNDHATDADVVRQIAAADRQDAGDKIGGGNLAGFQRIHTEARRRTSGCHGRSLVGE